MEPLSRTALLLWTLIIVAQPLLTVLLALDRTLALRWRPLLALLSFNSIRSFVLLGAYLASNPTAYFYVFWIGALIQAGLQCWLLWRVVSSHWPEKKPAWLVRSFFGVFFVALTICILSVANAPVASYGRLTRMVASADRCISLAWCAAFITFAAAAEVVRLKIRLDRMLIAAAFALQWTGESALSWVMALYPQHHFFHGSYIADCFYLAALASWSVVILRHQPILEPSEELQQFLDITTSELETEAQQF